MFGDRAFQHSTSTGTGTIDLGTVPAGRQSLVAAAGGGTEVLYVIEDANGSDWEIGLGTLTDASPDTLSRDTIRASTNAGSAISLSSGTHDVYIAIDAAWLADANAGAIVESGTNANGSYVRWENGEQASFIKNFTLSFDSAARCTATWTFPAGHTSTDIAISEILDNASVANDATPGRDELSATLQAVTDANNALILQYRASGATDFVSGDTLNVSLIAWGFWK